MKTINLTATVLAATIISISATFAHADTISDLNATLIQTGINPGKATLPRGL